MSPRRNIPELIPGFDRSPDGDEELRGSLLILDVGQDGRLGVDARVALILVDQDDNYLIDVGVPGRDYELLDAVEQLAEQLSCCESCAELLRQLVRDGWEHGACKLAAVVAALSHDGDT